jgi:CRISPR-associated endonuclease Csn1
MKKILGLDLGTNSIGWALVKEAENENEKSSIIKLGVRVIQYDNFVSTETGKDSMDPIKDFLGGKGVSANAGRTKKRSARRNLQRYKLRRENLIQILKDNNIINDNTILAETSNFSTFETYKLRAKAANDKISLEELARVLLMINKKRGYKSSRKLKGQDEGELVDGMDIAKELYNNDMTPGEYMLGVLSRGKKSKPEFYTSDLKQELQRIWETQKQYYPEILTDEFKNQIIGKSKTNTSKIFLAKYGIYTSENKGKDKKVEAYQWRVEALSKKVEKDVLAFVISDLNGIINNTSGYLGAISDRSKELYFNKLTIGQYLMNGFNDNPHFSVKNKVFYRQDYLDEFEKIWETQKTYHKELTNELKKEIRDIIIFYQRRLKSQKGLINYCEFENEKIEIEVEGKKKNITIGSKVCPKSSPLFQEFKIWQILNNLIVKDDKKMKED